MSKEIRAVARGQQCRQRCLSYRHCPARAVEGRAEFCAGRGEGPDDWQAITPDVLAEAPDGWCPLGLWSGLDLSATERQQEQIREHGWQTRIRSQVGKYGVALRIAMEGLETGAVNGRLEQMVELDILEPEAAAQIAGSMSGPREVQAREGPHG